MRLAVRDDGAGMSPEVLSRAFEPFFTTKPADQGTGLGLSMVHGVVRQSGGFVRLSSVLGEGTVVAIHLPVVEDAVTPAAPKSDVRRGGGEGCWWWKTSRWCAANGAAALDYVLAHPGEVDLVLTDVVMPRMNGLELASRLAERAPRVPVVVMSGYSDEEIVRRGSGPVNLSFLQKPLTSDTLVAAVRDRLDRARQALGAPG